MVTASSSAASQRRRPRRRSRTGGPRAVQQSPRRRRPCGRSGSSPPPRPARRAGARPARCARTSPATAGMNSGGERQHAHRVHAELGDQLGLAVQRGEDRRVRAGPDHLGRVRVEGQQQARPAHRPGPGDRGADQLLVPPVHAVEHADGDHRPARGQPGSPPAPASAARVRRPGRSGDPVQPAAGVGHPPVLDVEQGLAQLHGQRAGRRRRRR